MAYYWRRRTSGSSLSEASPLIDRNLRRCWSMDGIDDSALPSQSSSGACVSSMNQPFYVHSLWLLFGAVNSSFAPTAQTNQQKQAHGCV